MLTWFVPSPENVTDFDAQGTLEAAQKLPSNPQASPEVRYDGKTVIITGAGQGLGRAYALMYSRLGANVVINDLNEKAANSVVEEITKGMCKRTVKEECLINTFL